MEEQVRILLVEDFEPDAELAELEIRKTIPCCTFLLVDSKNKFIEALDHYNPHIIVSDYSMPQFDGMTALKLTMKKSNLIPFILFTGSLNEDTAVDCIKKGATDYIIKEHIKRLGESVKNALEQREVLIKKLEAEEESILYQERLQSLLKISQFKTNSIQKLLDYSLEEIVKITRSKIGYIYYYKEDKKEFILQTWPKEVFAEGFIGIREEAIKQRKAIILNDFTQPNQAKKDHPTLTRLLTIPILIDEVVVAVVGVGNKEIDYSESDINQLTLMMDSVWKIIEKKETELRLFQSIERFSMIYDYSPIGVAMIGINGFLTSSNHSFKDTFCVPSSIEVTNFNILRSEIISTNEREVLLQGNVISFEKEFTIQQLESIFQCKMNRSGKIDLEITIKAVETNPITHQFEFILQVQDITERKKVENIKNEFINIISHEMRTPLTSIRGSMLLMKKHYQDNLSEEQKNLLEITNRNISRLDKLVKDMLDFQKLNSVQMQFNKKPDSIYDLIQNIQEELKAFTNNSALQLYIEHKENLPLVFMDRDRITQVLFNLINNAVKFTEKGTITVKAEFEEQKNRVKVAVIDTGIGIIQKDIQFIFQPFYQVKKDMEHQTGGTGLGLSICKKILEGHESTLQVISDPGKGSTFYFYLPVAKGREK